MQIRSDLEQAPQEAGFKHPIEDTIRYALAQNPPELALHALRLICQDLQNPTLAAATINALASLDKPGNPHWRRRLIVTALRNHSPAVRDAAIMAAEVWQEPIITRALREHRDQEPHLETYRQAVLKDI